MRQTASLKWIAAAGLLANFCWGAWAQGESSAAARPTIEEKVEGMQRIDGFFPLYWDDETGHLWMEIARFDSEVLHLEGIAAGLGSNDIGIDRGARRGSRIVSFQRVGPKILMVEPNYRFRASSTNPDEIRAVRDAFAVSTHWSFQVAAETEGRVLVDLNDFLLRDSVDFASSLRPGSYRLDKSRSAVYLPMTLGFPENTEIEVSLTFVREGRADRARSRGYFEGVGAVAADAAAATLRLHHSWVKLPEPGYRTRAADPRDGYLGVSYADYSAPLGEPMRKWLIARHRLRKVDPTASVSDAVEPIVYYLDPGTPEPIRSALLDGARWWEQAFEAAGYRNAFRVEIRPSEISSHDIRYNVINWVHRSTRGWSYGSSVIDPRTGEIIKGVVTLGSLRVRQDYLIAEGLLLPYRTGDETPPELADWALARIRQLSAHEVGHTLGLGHNYYDSQLGRISVMDYPHPLITLTEDGTFDYSEVYDVGIGEWDKVAIAYGYQDFPAEVDEQEALNAILDQARARDLVYLTNQDLAAHPKVDQWSNGVDAAAELERMMDVRRVALQRFDVRAIKRGRPLATLEEVLVPLYMHHRYQVTAAASLLGGVDYGYALRGAMHPPLQPVSATAQRSALAALLKTLQADELTLPRSIVALIPPRPSGFFPTRELFPRYTGSTFDAITPALVAAGHTVSELLNPERAARIVQQSALDPSLPDLEEVLDNLLALVVSPEPDDAYQAEVARAVGRVIADRLLRLAAQAPMPQVRAVVAQQLVSVAEELNELGEETSGPQAGPFPVAGPGHPTFSAAAGGSLQSSRVSRCPAGRSHRRAGPPMAPARSRLV